MTNPDPKSLISLRNPVHALAVGFGSGLSPKAPGTFGTLAAIPCYLLFSSLPLVWFIGICILMSVVGIWICGKTAEDMKTHDHPSIVWDEFAGFFITMIAAPAGWLWVLVGFVLFRIFDILKPWPISYCDKHIHGGLGIMLDDILAGFMALACLQIIAMFVI